jgi:hypothetical protein
MPLIILLAIAVVAGYLIAKSRASKKIDDTAASVVSTTKTAVTQTSDRLRGRPSGEQLESWASGAGAEYLPQEFIDWLAGLSKEEANTFTGALTDHMNGLGFSLKDVVDGKLADQPEQAKTYSETIAAYSQTYRKAHAK